MHYPLTKLIDTFQSIRQNKKVQITLGVMPGVFCFIFTSAFLIDTLNIYGTLAINNKYTQEAIEQEVLYDVVGVDDKVNQIKTPKNLVITPRSDDYVCGILLEPYGYKYVAEEGSLNTSKIDFLEVDLDNDTYQVVGSEISETLPETSFLAYISLEDGDFYVNTENQRILLEDSINFKETEDKKVILQTNFTVPKQEDSSQIYFVNCLEDDYTHYNGIDNIYVRNINMDFVKNFIMGTNIIFFGLIVVLYIAALIYANLHYHLEYFMSKPVITVNIAGMTALVIGLFVAVFLLS